MGYTHHGKGKNQKITMTQKETALELIPKYEKDITILKLQERYLQRKVATIFNDRNWQLSLAKIQTQLKASEDYLNFLNEICESLESEYVDKQRQIDTLKKR